MKKGLDNVSTTSLPKFYVSSAVEYVFKKGETNDRALNKVRSSNRKSS